MPPEREAELVAGDAWAALAADLADLDALAPAVAAADEEEDEDEAEPRLRLVPLLLVVASFPVPPVQRALVAVEAALPTALFAAARADMAATESSRQEMAGSARRRRATAKFRSADGRRPCCAPGAWISEV